MSINDVRDDDVGRAVVIHELYGDVQGVLSDIDRVGPYLIIQVGDEPNSLPYAPECVDFAD